MTKKKCNELKLIANGATIKLIALGFFVHLTTYLFVSDKYC